MMKVNILDIERLISDNKLIPIKTFFDFNYTNISFDITDVNYDLLLEKLKQDCINHLWELIESKYIAIWNCDLQGFANKTDIYFDTSEDVYILAKLVYNDGKCFYYIVDYNIPVINE